MTGLTVESCDLWNGAGKTKTQLYLNLNAAFKEVTAATIAVKERVRTTGVWGGTLYPVLTHPLVAINSGDRRGRGCIQRGIHT
jgi:hypothetical protein